MTNNQNKHNQKEPGHLGGRPGGEKRSNEPIKKGYYNHTTEFERPSETTIARRFGKNKKKD
ncbi:hypothetical protein [Staphylococcus epidermidis]|uniref:hypothetical protein n=1 Tax=Staphylococcus epidermidis TaxID=1282 RepID=UPI0034D41C20